MCIADPGTRMLLTGGPYAYVAAAFGPYAGCWRSSCVAAASLVYALPRRPPVRPLVDVE